MTDNPKTTNENKKAYGGKKEADETRTEEKNTKSEKKSENKKKSSVKIVKEFAMVNSPNLKISTKYAISICKFIKNKTIEQAILDLEQVILGKKAVPMKGEIPHRHGRGMMSGRFPKRAAVEFISVLKSAFGNANANGIDEPVIVEAIANIGDRPYAKYGIRRKRTHLRIKVKNKIDKKISNIPKPRNSKSEDGGPVDIHRTEDGEK